MNTETGTEVPHEYRPVKIITDQGQELICNIIMAAEDARWNWVAWQTKSQLVFCGDDPAEKERIKEAYETPDDPLYFHVIQQRDPTQKPRSIDVARISAVTAKGHTGPLADCNDPGHVVVEVDRAELF